MSIARGRAMYRARRGDQYAQAQVAEPADPDKPSVQRGRQQWRDKHRQPQPPQSK